MMRLSHSLYCRRGDGVLIIAMAEATTNHPLVSKGGMTRVVRMRRRNAPKRSRGWVFTINNYNEFDIERVKTIECKGMKAGLEVGESGTPHIQGAVYFENAISLESVRKRISTKGHYEAMRGSWEHQDYCLKDEQVIRNYGEGPQQGKRVDIEEFRDAIKSGLTEEDAYEQYFPIMAKYPRFYGGYKDAMNRKKFRTEMTKCKWYWGGTNVGKSHRIIQPFIDSDSMDMVYQHEAADKGWWDGYEGQPIVVLNEFHGEISYAELLTLIDKWPKDVSRRGRAPTPFLAKEILISSPSPPEKVYSRQNEKDDSIQQLLRRVEVIHCTEREE